jgi:hypothetical protein
MFLQVVGVWEGAQVLHLILCELRKAPPSLGLRIPSAQGGKSRLVSRASPSSFGHSNVWTQGGPVLHQRRLLQGSPLLKGWTINCQEPLPASARSGTPAPPGTEKPLSADDITLQKFKGWLPS